MQLAKKVYMQQKGKKPPMAPQTIFKDDIGRQHGDSAQQIWKNELEHEEEVHEEREIPPKDPTKQRFHVLLSMMKNIAEKMQQQNKHVATRESQESGVGLGGSPRTTHTREREPGGGEASLHKARKKESREEEATQHRSRGLGFDQEGLGFDRREPVFQRSKYVRMVDDGEYSLFTTGSTKDPLAGEPMMERFFERNAPKMVATPPSLPHPSKSIFLQRQEHNASLISPL